MKNNSGIKISDCYNKHQTYGELEGFDWVELTDIGDYINVVDVDKKGLYSLYELKVYINRGVIEGKPIKHKWELLQFPPVVAVKIIDGLLSKDIVRVYTYYDDDGNIQYAVNTIRFYEYV